MSVAVNGSDRKNSTLFFIIFLFLVVGVLCSGVLAYRSFEKYYRSQAEQQVSSIAELKIREIEQWRKERIGDAEILNGNIAFSKLVQQYFKKPEDKNTIVQIKEWLSEYPNNYDYSQARLIDSKGSVRFSYPLEEASVSTAVLDRIPEVIRTKKITFIDFYRHEQDSQIYLSLLVPITEPSVENRVIGVVSLRIKPEKFLYPILLRWPTPSETGETFLVRREGNEVLFLSEAKHKKKSALNFRLPLSNPNVPAVMAAMGKSGIVEGVDYHDTPAIADVRAVPDSPWFLVSHMDLHEVYLPLQSNLWMLILAVLGLIAGTVSILFVFWRKQVQSVLEKSERKYRAIFERANDGILIADIENMKFRFANPAACKLFGYAENELTNLSVEEVHPKENLEYVRAQFKAQSLGEKTISENIPCLRKDGTAFFADVSSKVVLIDNKQHLAGFFRDITERKKIEAALRESEERYRGLLNYLDAAVVVHAPDTSIIMNNPKAAELLGLSDDQLKGKTAIDPAWKFLREDGTPLPIEEYPVNAISRHKKAIKNLIIGINRPLTQDLVWGSVNGYPVINNEGKISEIVISFIDITEVKKASDALLAAKKAAEEVAASKSNFLDIAAHELRTPITVLTLVLQIAQKQIDNGQVVSAAMIARLKGPAERLSRLVTELLDYSRLERGIFVLKLVRSDISLLVAECVEEFRLLAPERSIEFHQVDKPIEINMDALRIHEVISNLIDNAMKYTPADCSIEVKVESTLDAVRVSVIDHGNGISAEQQRNLFSAFKRGSGDENIRTSGLGLGLSVCRGIIALHGGIINVLSESGRGSTFYFEIPRKG